jgi:hypothetical protein
VKGAAVDDAGPLTVVVTVTVSETVTEETAGVSVGATRTVARVVRKPLGLTGEAAGAVADGTSPPGMGEVVVSIEPGEASGAEPATVVASGPGMGEIVVSIEPAEALGAEPAATVGAGKGGARGGTEEADVGTPGAGTDGEAEFEAGAASAGGAAAGAGGAAAGAVGAESDAPGADEGEAEPDWAGAGAAACSPSLAN